MNKLNLKEKVNLKFYRKTNRKLSESHFEKEKEAEKTVTLSYEILKGKFVILKADFIVSGQDLKENFHDRDSDESDHFLDEFHQKIRDIDVLKAEPIKDLYVSPLRSPNLFLVEIETPSNMYNKRLNIQSFLSVDVRKQLNGKFEWTGKDG